MNICPKEISKLAQYLAVMEVPFDAHPLFDGYQIVVNIPTMKWDVICHSWSYGHEVGLLEIMGSIVDKENTDDAVEGWLTAEEIAMRVKKIIEAN